MGEEGVGDGRIGEGNEGKREVRERRRKGRGKEGRRRGEGRGREREEKEKEKRSVPDFFLQIFAPDTNTNPNPTYLTPSLLKRCARKAGYETYMYQSLAPARDR